MTATNLPEIRFLVQPSPAPFPVLGLSSGAGPRPALRQRSYLLLPFYWLCERLPATREGASRLGLVTLEQMVNALVAAIENPSQGIRIVDVPKIRQA